MAWAFCRRWACEQTSKGRARGFARFARKGFRRRKDFARFARTLLAAFCEQRSAGRQGLCSFARRGFAVADDFARLLARQSAEPERKPRGGGVMVRMIFLLMLSLRSGQRLQQKNQSINSRRKSWGERWSPRPLHRLRPVAFLYANANAHARTGKPSAASVDTGMKTFHEWLTERQRRQCEGLWLNDKNAVVGLSKPNPLPQDSAVNKNLSKRPAKAATPTVKPFKPAQPAKLQPFKPKAVGKVG